MQVLRVYPNPFIAKDKNGTPCGLCPRDPEADAGGPGMFVGARVDRKNTRKLQDFGKMAPHELRSERQHTLYEYLGISSLDAELADKLAQKDPIELPVTKYYRDRLIEGSIIPADAETARLARIVHFTAPAQFFALQKPKAAEEPAAPEAKAEQPQPSESLEPSFAELDDALLATAEASAAAVELSTDFTSPETAVTTKSRKSRNEG